MYGYASSAHDNNEKVLHATLNARNFTNIANTGNALKVDYVVQSPSDLILIESQQGKLSIF